MYCCLKNVALSGCMQYRKLPSHSTVTKYSNTSEAKKEKFWHSQTTGLYELIREIPPRGKTVNYKYLYITYIYVSIYVQRRIQHSQHSQNSDAHSADRFSIQRHDGNSIDFVLKTHTKLASQKVWLIHSAGHVIWSCDFTWPASLLAHYCSGSIELYSVVSLVWIG